MGSDRVSPPTARAGDRFWPKKQEQTIRLGTRFRSPRHDGRGEAGTGGVPAGGRSSCAGIIWDLAVDEQKGELYVLSDPRPVQGSAELRVFDRQGEYLRTIMPLNPTLPRSSVRDLCRKTAREGEAELVIPKLFETLCGSLSLYGAWWHLPQKMALAPDGDLIMSNIYRGTVWRMRPDGSLPLEGWTSVYHRGRNEPFESPDWTQDCLECPGSEELHALSLTSLPLLLF